MGILNIKTRIIPGNRKPIAGNHKDMKYQWFWEGDWVTVSFFDIDYYVKKYGVVDSLIDSTLKHLEWNEEGLYPSWFKKRNGEYLEGGERVKRFFDELWNKGHSIKKLCLEHKLKHIIQIG